EPQAMAGTETAATIPADRLRFGQAYFVNIEFAKAIIVDTNSYPGAFGALLFFHTTEFYLRTRLLPDTSGLVGWWRGDDNASDAVGTNNGTMYNGRSFAAGVVRDGFQFGGGKQFVKIPPAPELNPSNQLTIQFWMEANPSGSFNSAQGLVVSDYYGIEIGPGVRVSFYV